MFTSLAKKSVLRSVATLGFACLISGELFAQPVAAYKPPRHSVSVFLTNEMERPLRYTPIETDFVITNGTEFFNRSLYGGSSAFRVDAGDKPEFSLYLPGRGGNLRLGIKTPAGVKWLNDAKEIVARYRPGMMVYEVRDPLLGADTLTIESIATRANEGLLVQAELHGNKKSAASELIFAFGGVNGMRGRRDGDIGCEREPVSQFFQLQPEQCRSNEFVLAKKTFIVRGQPGVVGGVVSSDATFALADADGWADANKLLAKKNPQPHLPLLVGQVKLAANQKIFIGLQRLTSGVDAKETLSVYREVAVQTEVSSNSKAIAQWKPGELEKLFNQEEANRQALANRVAVNTPDPFINAAAAALNVAADAVWDDRQEAYLHGGVAWRVRLLGWRVSYAGDELGWHERTAKHFAGFAKQQNTNAIPDTILSPEESANLSRNENALHTNGDMTKSHYDMNLVGVDAFFRHLLWTGDLEYARAMWSTIERHLAWERRLFRREFGADKSPLYEAYCCIWASDDLAYNGGGATHSSAYNLYHNRMAARVAKLLGKDASLYEQEAEAIAKGLRENLWLADRGWFAEWKDLLGLQLVHPNAAAWTFYHTVDSEVPTPLEAWQMTRFVDTEIARFPIEGPGVPTGNCTMPTTSWMPYTWSLNNVVLGETMHTALAYWQANRSEEAFPLFKGAVLDSMYLGLCPGNVGMCTWFDATRRESQRDFGDGSGAMSRALVEGLFGVKPDLLAGKMFVQPGFPPEWNHAEILHPDFHFAFQREGVKETFTFENNVSKPLKLQLQIAALRDGIAKVTVNGRKADWRMVPDSVGVPRIEINGAAERKHIVCIEWQGKTPTTCHSIGAIKRGGGIGVSISTARIKNVSDPQNALAGIQQEANRFSAKVVGQTGHRTVFAKVEQGDLQWWLPITFEIQYETIAKPVVDWNAPVVGTFESIDLSSALNDSVTQIFRNEYRSPRSPFASLAMPKQGFGSWCHPKDTFEVDDSGLRMTAAKNDGKIFLPNGIPFVTAGTNTGTKNIAFVSQWENYPREISVPLTGKSSHAFLLMAGSTDAMKSRFDNGEVIATYVDGSTARLALHNPTTWWPIDQDYYIDDFAFARPGPLPPRVDLKTGKVRILNMENFKGTGKTIPGGAATVLDLPLDATKELKSLTVRALANEVVIGLMSVTLQR